MEGLKEDKRHKEALTILEQFYGNSELTISYAIECGEYKTALRLCSRYNKNNLKGLPRYIIFLLNVTLGLVINLFFFIEEKLLPAILEEYNNMKGLIEMNWATFLRHHDRLQVVRENKTKHPVDTLDFYTNKDSDLYSDAGSTVASSSRGSR